MANNKSIIDILLQQKEILSAQQSIIIGLLKKLRNGEIPEPLVEQNIIIEEEPPKIIHLKELLEKHNDTLEPEMKLKSKTIDGYKYCINTR